MNAPLPTAAESIQAELDARCTRHAINRAWFFTTLAAAVVGVVLMGATL